MVSQEADSRWGKEAMPRGEILQGRNAELSVLGKVPEFSFSKQVRTVMYPAKVQTPLDTTQCVHL